MPNSMVMNWTIHTGLSDCELICSRNCSCTAYASLHDDGAGCELYYGDKSDLLNMIERGNNTVYVRDDAPESGKLSIISLKLRLLEANCNQLINLVWLIDFYLIKCRITFYCSWLLSTLIGSKLPIIYFSAVLRTGYYS